ncbi:uncharacterized protein [Macrobrachium rosenbergii]|uniref:uncharacterized protein n=1 Tax=Macrobrachium rosenbergii TaxID=79674 RepID=UPI0034D69265
MSLVGYKDESHSLMVAAVPDICTPLFCPSVPDEEIMTFSKLQLADDCMNNRHLNVDILVGLNAYWRFMVPNKTVQSKNLVTWESVFGWVLSGSCDIPLDRVSVTSQLLCINNVSESDLHKFWDLESVEISSKEAVSNEFSSSTVLQKCSDNIKFIDGRYEVSLPWKSDVAKQSLKNNEKLACKRLENLNLKFVKTPGLRERYDEVFEEYEKDDNIDEVPHSEISSVYPIYYLPHCPVIRGISNSTKVRPVFDASAVSYNGISLNDCLEWGPSLNPDLEVLIRFRRWKVALTADITKAFLQIKVQREDQDVHRFLWQNKGIVHVMRFVRVPFGNKSNPFLLNATIKHHLISYPNSEVVDELNCNLYVDDWLSGDDSITEACVKFDKACKIMSEAGMSLSKWSSNCKSLTDKFNENPNDCCGNKSIKILGMQWVSTHDYFSFSEVNVGSQMGVVSTKSSVLSLIARCFDPLGLISPFVMFAKILFQDVGRIGLKWDDVLPEELHCKFQRWFRGFEKLGSWKVQRCYFEDLSWKDLTGLKLHSFGDASEKRYGACVYLRVPLQDGSFKASLVMSRDLCYESKHPIILPSTHVVKTLVRFQHVILKHSGVSTHVSTLRNGYWIVRLRRIAKTVCRECVTCHRCELETTLHEVEACINSRPLTIVGEEVDTSNPLTPSHFLIGRTAGVQPEVVEEHSSCVSSKDLCMRETARHRQLDKFWEIWSSDYIRNLPCAIKGFVSKCNVKKGSVVLVKEDNVRRLSWPLGVIIEVYPGKDGVIRSVDVKTSKGIVNRLVQKLHDLEISNVLDTEAEDSIPCIVSEVNDESVPKPVSNHSDVNADDSDPDISQSRVEPISYTVLAEGI